MKHRVLVALTALGTCASLGSAQLYSYVTAVVTECAPEDDAHATDAASPADATTTAPAEHGTVAYEMPSCACGCPTCTFTSVYTTAYPILCPTGVSDQTYTITETYIGMSTLLEWPEPTETPYGFTTVEATCSVCGDSPVTTVITCPSGGSTYYDAAQNTALPTQAAAATSPAAAESPSSAAAASSAPVTTGAAAVSPAASNVGTAGEDAGSVDTAVVTKSLVQAAGTKSQNAAESVAQSKPTSVPAGYSNNAGTQPSAVPVKVSGASITSGFMTPVLCIVGLITAHLALR